MVSSSAFDLLTNSALSSTIMLTLTWLVTVVYRRGSASLLHGLWTIGMGCCLLIPIIVLIVPIWSLPILPQNTDPEPKKQHSAAVPNGLAKYTIPLAHPDDLPLKQPASTLPTSNHSLLTVGSIDSSAQFEHSNHWSWPAWKNLLISIWAFGSMAMLFRLAMHVRSATCVQRLCHDEIGLSWNLASESASTLIGLKSPPRLKVHSELITPMVVGVIRPVVILPSGSEHWSVERKEMVLLHEFSHIRRHDVLTQILAAICTSMFWFNPLVWWGAIQMRRLREIACDDAVVRVSNIPADYAQTLLDVARGYHCRQLPYSVAMARGGGVESRIYSVLSSTRSRMAFTGHMAHYTWLAAFVTIVIITTCRLTSNAQTQTVPENAQSPTSQTIDSLKTMKIRVVDENGDRLPDTKIHVSVWEKEKRSDYANRDYITDESGTVVIERPAKLEIIRLWASKDRYVPMFVNFAEGTHEEGLLIPDEFAFKLPKGHRLSGKIVDADGKPIEGAHVQVMVGINESTTGTIPDPIISVWLAEDKGSAVTAEDGRWEINNAPAKVSHSDFKFSLQVTHPQFAGDTSWGGIQHEQGVTTLSLRDGSATIVLKKGVVIHGTVRDPDGNPISKGIVVWNDRPYWATGVNESAINESGQFSTIHLAPGSYPLTVLAPGYAPQRLMVDAKSEPKPLEIKMQKGSSVRIKIVDSAGNPIPKAYVGIGGWRGTEAIYNEVHSNVLKSEIPRRADNDGIYEWSWAPNDGVRYNISAENFDTQQITLVAQPELHEVRLSKRTVVTGNVVDAQTGKPVERFLAIPVQEFSKDFYSTDYQESSVAHGSNGAYSLSLERHKKERYRVRVEADGYRSALGNKFFSVGSTDMDEDFYLEKVPAQIGTVVDQAENPVEKFIVIVATPTMSPSFTTDGRVASFGKSFRVNGGNKFELAASFEPQRIRVFNDSGFAERYCKVDEPIGQLKLLPWAKLSGRLLQDGKPVANESVYFRPLTAGKPASARFQDSYGTLTNSNGEFHFEKMPPMAGHVTAYLGPWQESLLTSSQSVPVTLTPGDDQKVHLNDSGIRITGRVVAKGRDNQNLNKNWSINYLIDRNNPSNYSADAEGLRVQPEGPLQKESLSHPDFHAWLQTRSNFFVKLKDDGSIKITGVKPGQYDLIIQLYEEPTGCLVETIGEAIIPVTIQQNDLREGELSLGVIEIECRQGPRVGSDMRSIQFTDETGKVMNVDDFSGRHVVLQAWASWCAPCIDAMPEISSALKKYKNQIAVIGLNLDEDPTHAKELVRQREWNWAQTFIGKDSALSRQLAISSLPSYYIVGPDGKLIGSCQDWSDIEEFLASELKQ